MSAGPQEEKRKHPRRKATYLVSYRVRQVLEDFDMSQSKDVSQGGMLLMTHKHYQPGTVLELLITFPLITQRIKVAARVIGSKEVVKNFVYETRVTYIDIDEDFFRKLGRFIDANIR